MAPYVRPQLSVVIPVLESYEICRRQVLHWERLIPSDWEILVVDDGSDPPLTLSTSTKLRLSVIYTRDRRRWTQPLARNLGARVAAGEYLWLTDIDHILSAKAVATAAIFAGDRLLFQRRHGVLDESGVLQTDSESLARFAARKVGEKPDFPVHQNTFVIRRDVFLEKLGGYDEAFGARGEYGGDDVDFNSRYAELVKTGQLRPDAMGPPIYVFPEPAESTLFHRLARN
jgi:glycosyltransferase involved in cell wall biosynthesis